ncbi:MAG: DUF86 domain-containing protein [Muribaculaceae bacterium]|nr:DUF86 domain-containing protein [Muribaculaceae bacterium]MDE5594851.1 DUF86 domain-containing protein [Muribaculaceae bacterium]MDE6704243.1 DUF86 domain-containing protein [Muribaculaceae bacterium]
MDDAVYKYLSDVLDSIIEIEEETDIRGRRFEVYCSDRVYRKFIERNIAIIGEAMNQILRLSPNIQISAGRKIVDTRNLVVHSYDSIDNEIIWAIIIRHLPLLKQEVTTLLDKE